MASSVTTRWYSLQYSLKMPPSGPGWWPGEEAGERAQAEPAHDLHLGVAPRQALADDRVVGEAALRGQRESRSSSAWKRIGDGGRRLAPLVAEQRHGHGPAVVHAADDVVLRGTWRR